ncbi:MAG TPA: RDD family protein, partial [Candidatus Acidoferrales bacterium]|nr:RDD family protein [Candidatus Acidoferrales bacterium]
DRDACRKPKHRHAHEDMRMVSWHDGRVDTQDSIAMGRPPDGDGLRVAFVETVHALTLGLVTMRGSSLTAGRLELLRFGAAKITRNAVEWPIEGGLLARAGGGSWRLASADGRVTATVKGYMPLLPRLVYSLSHLQVHLLFTRLLLLRVRGREPAPGRPASRTDRLRAASIDLAFCLTLAGIFGRRRRLGTLLAFTAGYHVACWSISGRTLGGVVMRHRVVALDGSRLTPQQSLLRFALLPLSWVTRRPVHDDIAGTEVVSDRKEEGAAQAAPSAID